MLGAIDQGNVDVFKVFRRRVVNGRRRIGGASEASKKQAAMRARTSRPCASYLIIDDICGALFDLCAQILVVRVVETKPVPGPQASLDPLIQTIQFGAFLGHAQLELTGSRR
jgi:hypothetical protein